MNSKVFSGIIVGILIISVGFLIAFSLLQNDSEPIPTNSTMFSKSWVGKVQTQCGDPWHSDLMESYKKTSDKNDVSSDSSFYNSLESENIIKKYYENKGITIFDFKHRENVVNPSLCEGCGCNTSGVYYFLVSDSDLDSVGGYVIPKEKVLKYSSNQLTWKFQVEEFLDPDKRYYGIVHDIECPNYIGTFLDEDGKKVPLVEKGFFQDLVDIDYSQCTD